MSIEVIDPASAAGIASAALAQVLATFQQVVAQATSAAGSATAAAASQAAVQALVSGLGLPVRWTGTSLQILLPDGTYTAAVDLEGPQGGVGPTPTFHVGQVSVGTPSVTITALDPLNPIVDFVLAPGTPGTNGTNGTSGWTPVLSIYTDGQRRVLEVTDWTGGTGTKPATGLYVSASGLTSILVNAIDLRGAPGANGTGTGTVVTSGAVSTGHAAVFGDTTGDTIVDGGPLHATTGTVTSGHQAVFADATGTVFKDGGAPFSTSGSVTAGHLAGFADGTGKVFQDAGVITAFGQNLIAAATAAAVKALLAIGVADVSGAEATANKGQANGYASLDSGGKLPSTQLPAIATGSLNYQGTWNAAANSPTLASGTGTKGVFYKVSTAGTTTLDGISQWFVGDVVAFDGATWDRLDGGTTSVHTVAGLVGDITAAALKANLAIASTDITDATSTGKSVLTAANAAAVKALLAIATGDVSGLGNAATKNVGTTTGTVAAGDDSRFAGAPDTDLQLFGDGSDGNATISSGTVTLTRDMYYNNLTLSGTGQINTAGYKVFVLGTLDISAAAANAITYVPLPGNAATGNSANFGAAATTANTGTTTGAGTSGQGGNGAAVASVNTLAAVKGSAVNYLGGASGNGGPGGTGGTSNQYASAAAVSNPSTPVSLRIIAAALLYGASLVCGGAPASGGIGGGGDGTNAAGAGGGGAPASGNVLVFARTINRGAGTAAGAISSPGGQGGAGGNSANANAAGGGGGGGAGGGFLMLAYRFLTGATATGALSAPGGAGGNGGVSSTGIKPGTGGNGGSGGVILIGNAATGAVTSTIGATPAAASSVTGGLGGTCAVNL